MSLSMTVPNLLSVLRMGLVPLFVIAVLDGEAKKALVVFLLAGITDALDGAIARIWHQQSLLGTYLDPLADKLLLASSYVVLAIPEQHPGVLIPVWVTVLVLFRDLTIVAIALALHLTIGVKSFPPTLLSKLTTVAQVAAVGLVLLSGLTEGIDQAAEIALYTVGALTLASGLAYLLRINHLAGRGTDRAQMGP